MTGFLPTKTTFPFRCSLILFLGLRGAESYLSLMERSFTPYQSELPLGLCNIRRLCGRAALRVPGQGTVQEIRDPRSCRGRGAQPQRDRRGTRDRGSPGRGEGSGPGGGPRQGGRGGNGKHEGGGP